MPDADWVKYKKLRGRPLPEAIEHGGSRYAQERLLKFDFYAATGLFRREGEGTGPEQLLYKSYHTDRMGPIPLGWLGRWLGRRESHYLGRLEGVEGIPQLLDRRGDSTLLREFIPGVNLREFGRQKVDEDFFPRLKAILADVHARGIAHNDLSKPENVLVATDGRPILIDFQIAKEATFARWPLLGRLGRRLIRYFQGVDAYHLQKLYRRYRPLDFTSEERDAMRRRKGSLLRIHHALIRNPYRAVRHAVLNRFLKAEGPHFAATSASTTAAGSGSRPRGEATRP